MMKKHEGAMFQIIVTALLIAAVFGIAIVGQPKQIVTFEITAPDGQHSTVKSIVGGSPMTLTDQNGATWKIFVRVVEVR